MINFKTRLGYLLGVGAIFYASYGSANFLTALREDIPEIVFGWEQHIPFLAWTIVPYWSLNLLYALAFFLCQDLVQLRHYTARLLLAQGIAVLSFLLFPLQISWQKLETTGISGFLFESLAGFDQPYNQAPSLHIILTIVVGAFYWRIFPKWRLLLCFWFGLIALSILTTYQHHFLDLPTGALVGFLVLWLLPEHGSCPIVVKTSQNLTASHYRLMICYGIGVMVCVWLAYLGGAWLWLIWGAVALCLVVLAYGRGVTIFQKQANGKLSAAACALGLPYFLGARLNIVYWLWGKPKSAVIFENISVGSIVVSSEFNALLDCCAELPCPNPSDAYEQAFMLDLIAPSAKELCNAAEKLEHLQQTCSSVLVCCALGYGRSVAVVLTWLLATHKVADLEQAIMLVKQARPQMVISNALRQSILQADKLYQEKIK
ncbi:phosphatase [Rodentibacter pneumotropicus]|uniref:Phosphatase PAP2/dual specificity phosphatase family protein n=1 Tax=Rodentibacter pneumotropicus TaxID=758 RepID=A0AAW5LCY6_9PAST|nr:phosphatase PAP2/dual specificity phosphatase family protein [Rodentibacter pneumotropicus]MCQ9121920.1 phosphatase PAP2/dual specificity phosphatase family protein [Rodentibacter pneumotropicus]OOF68101.1 phosphatase [Rodentibacter pneumotropicus]